MESAHWCVYSCNHVSRLIIRSVQSLWHEVKSWCNRVSYIANSFALGLDGMTSKTLLVGIHYNRRNTKFIWSIRRSLYNLRNDMHILSMRRSLFTVKKDNFSVRASHSKMEKCKRQGTDLWCCPMSVSIQVQVDFAIRPKSQLYKVQQFICHDACFCGTHNVKEE